MYNETMYLNYNDLNTIENRILTLTNRLRQYNPSTPTFSSKQWFVNDFPYIQEIDRIEKGIDNLQKYWYKPDGWEECKVWLTGEETEQVIKSFSFEDINRWVIDLDLMEEVIGDESTIWNLQSYIYWNQESNEDWREN